LESCASATNKQSVSPAAAKPEKLPNDDRNQKRVEDERSVLPLSPACLPFRYREPQRGKHARRKQKKRLQKDYYEEFWTGKAFERPTKIKFLHMRKAGGSSLFRYFQRVVASNKSFFQEFEACEGQRHCLDLNDSQDGYHKYYDDELGGGNDKPGPPWDDSGETFYVTQLREPVARALSHYRYSMRFACPRTKPNATDFVLPSAQDELMTLEDFAILPILGPINHKDFQGPLQSHLWGCNSNCYARWVTGMYHPMVEDETEFHRNYPNVAEYYYENRKNDTTGSEGDYHQTTLTPFGRVLSDEALKLLLRYDLIIVLEWLSDKHYAKLLQDVFFGGVRGMGQRTAPYCDRQMKYINSLVPLEIKNATLERLHQVNDIDARLYRTLTSCET
jgi:hypothetical protein